MKIETAQNYPPVTREKELQDLPWAISTALPLFVFLGPYILTALSPDVAFYQTWIESEQGLVENLTVLLALLGIAVAIVAARRSTQAQHRLLTAWLVLFAVGFLYVATEEASWGQHWFPWETPDWLASANRYGEANLHNTAYGIDRIPKSIVGLCIVLGGLAWPLYRRWRGIVWRDAKDWQRWLLPTNRTVLMATCFLFAWLVNRVQVWFELDHEGGDGFANQEHRELMMVAFLLIYTISIAQRLRIKGSALKQGA